MALPALGSAISALASVSSQFSNLGTGESYFGEELKAKLRQMPDLTGVFRTVLERCKNSGKTRLIDDLYTHRIPEKIEAVNNQLTCKHRHEWNGQASATGQFDLIRCANKESEWNDGWTKTLIVGAGVLAAPFLMGLPTVATSMIVHEINSHAAETKQKIADVVTTVEALYSQTLALMVANGM
eukprot:TRINITY_DN1409_c0_g1_i17.p1 TRINITY_DN1409_c0_g1~~TRINITY_DN1409_c0_g1_i17.p1  ORF type:complete len:183 (+),score=15.29 TRINITY_DN1409_c0_g1_i17:80-628(+)